MLYFGYMQGRFSQNTFLRSLIRRMIAIGVATAMLIATLLMCKNQDLAELMSRTVSRYLLACIGFVTSLLPVSVFEAAIIVTIIVMGVGIVRFLASLKRHPRRSILMLLNVVSVALCVIVFYQFCVGFAYYRKPLDLSVAQKEMSDEFTAKAASYFTEDFAYLASTLERDKNGCVVSPYTQSQLSQRISEEYKRLDGGYLSSYTPRYKEVVFSFVMAELKIVGVFFGGFGEANISRLVLDYEKPAYIAHELAHAKGVMREYEAELTAAYLLLTSEDEFFRYSAYMFFYSSIMFPLYWINNQLYNELYGRIPSVVNDEITASFKVYSRFNHISDLGERLNDLYLRFNGQKDGTDSYHDVGETIIIDSPQTGEPPIYTHYYSTTEKLLLSIYAE